MLPERLSEAVLTGQAPVPAAAVAAAEMLRLLPDLQPGFVAAGWQAFTELAKSGDVSEVRKLRPALIAQYGDGNDGKDDEIAGSRAFLSRGVSDGGALVDYRMGLDPESAAILESALESLTDPVPGPDGEPDPRPWATRRAHALIDLITRATKKSDTQVVLGRSSTHTTVIITLEDLVNDEGVGQTMNGLDAGRFLSIPVIRAMSCNGHLTPVVVDVHGNPILIGRTQRLFTPTQVHAIAARDGGCTFPGCTRPPDWSDAHHRIHWADGGHTDLDNAALLCRMHHSVAHSRQLAGTLTTGPPGSADEHRFRVVWDLTPGSYRRALAANRAGPAAA